MLSNVHRMADHRVVVSTTKGQFRHCLRTHGCDALNSREITEVCGGETCWNLPFWVCGKDVPKYNCLRVVSEVLDTAELNTVLCRNPGAGENYYATEGWSWRSLPCCRSQILEQSFALQEPAETAYWKQGEKPFSCNVSSVPSPAKVNTFQLTKRKHLKSSSSFSYNQQGRVNLRLQGNKLMIGMLL